MQLSKQEALAALDDWDEINDTVTDTHRWYAIHTVILQHPDGKYYSVAVAYGLTEDQEIEPFSEESVCFEEVEPRAIVTIQFRSIKQATSDENIRAICKLNRNEAAQLARDLHNYGPN